MRKKLLLLVAIVLTFMLVLGACGGKEDEKKNNSEETEKETNELEDLDVYYVKKTSDDEAAYYAVHIDGDKVEYLGERYWKKQSQLYSLGKAEVREEALYIYWEEHHPEDSIMKQHNPLIATFSEDKYVMYLDSQNPNWETDVFTQVTKEEYDKFCKTYNIKMPEEYAQDEVSVTEAPAVTEAAAATTAPTATPTPTPTEIPTYEFTFSGEGAPLEEAMMFCLEPLYMCLICGTTLTENDLVDIFDENYWTGDRAVLTVLLNHLDELNKTAFALENYDYLAQGMYVGDNWEELVQEYLRVSEAEKEAEKAKKEAEEAEYLSNLFLNVPLLDDKVLYNESGVTFAYDEIFIADAFDNIGDRLRFKVENQNEDNKKVFVRINGFAINGIQMDSRAFVSGKVTVLNGESADVDIAIRKTYASYENAIKALGYPADNSTIMTLEIDFSIKVGSKSEYEEKRVVLRTENYDEDKMNSLYGTYITQVSPRENILYEIYMTEGEFGRTFVMRNISESVLMDITPYIFVNGTYLATQQVSSGLMYPNNVCILNSTVTDSDFRKQNEIGNSEPLEFELRLNGKWEPGIVFLTK